MYHIQIGINISSEAKTDFIVNELIPFLEEHVKDNYYFTRSVNVIPVIDLYLNTSDIKITYIYSKIQSIFDKYLSNLSEASVQENKYYLDNQKNISRVNGYSACIPIENLTIKCEKIEAIKRDGEYNHPIDKEIYTDYFIKGQKVLEKAIKFLYNRDEDIQLKLLFGMFYSASMQLDKTGIGYGYLSFKSHLLGFLSYRHKDMGKYKKMFQDKFAEMAETLSSFGGFIENNFKGEVPEQIPEEIIEICREWESLYSNMYQELLTAENETNTNKAFSISLSMQHRRFRSLSSFHKAAFSNANKDFFKKKEFQAYRMLVNFVYLLLPAMGLNSRKRVEASYLLVNTKEA